MKECTSCGTKNRNDAPYCQGCGIALDKSAEESRLEDTPVLDDEAIVALEETPTDAPSVDAPAREERLAPDVDADELPVEAGEASLGTVFADLESAKYLSLIHI